ncbi:MAG: AzlC family ABC transporter permease [Lachnospiraceae bacterium]|jgi:predicted branched-subunit amino acid permease|nr:AzlC family ABC transporter permease [Lachnospiraceae bacterium]MBR5917003.1 AzlC family ABC transporter permease [Lachnospiraceae bacterium]
MSAFRKGITDGIPIGLGYLAVSFSFGILAVAGGLNVWQATLISMTNLTSAGQFAGLTIMISGGSIVEMIISQFIINLRYSLMSISLSQHIDKTMKLPQKLFFGEFHTDEIFAVSMGRPEKLGKTYFLGVIIAPYIGWSLGTFLGAVCGEILPAMVVSALGVALYGMFIAIVVPPMKHSWKMSIVVGLAVIMSVCFAYVPGLKNVSSGFAIIICAVLASLFGALVFPVKEEKDLKTEKN